MKKKKLSTLYKKELNELVVLYRVSTIEAEKKMYKTIITSKMLPIVKQLTSKIARRATDPIEDLIQAGLIGVLKAINSYDYKKNDNFKIYSSYLIIGEIKHYLRDKSNLIRIPGYIIELNQRINNFILTLNDDEIANMTTEQLAFSLNVEPKIIDIAINVERRYQAASLDELGNVCNESYSYEEKLSKNDYKEEENLNDTKIILADLIKKLSPEEKIIIEMFYNQDLKKTDIAKLYGLTNMQVTRILKKTFNKFYKYLNDGMSDVLEREEVGN